MFLFFCLTIIHFIYFAGPSIALQSTLRDVILQNQKTMFTQMRTFNLKTFGVILFTSVFLIGGFFINTTKTEASSRVTSFGVSYSMSSVITTTNTDGSITTKILVGCAPKSGDLYDINTGMPCNNNVKTVLEGCRIGSGDLYDVNTGIACSSYIKSMIVGCASKSGDIYDINTGNKCGAPKVIAKLNKTETLTPKDLTLLTPVNKEGTSSNKEDSSLSGRETLKNSLTASVAKAGSIFKGPMSIWIILLIIVILLVGGYAIYGLLKKDKKEDIKQPTTKPITPNSSPVQPPLSATVKATPSVTEPIFKQTQTTNNPQTQQSNPQNNTNPSATSPNNPNPQGQIFGK